MSEIGSVPFSYQALTFYLQNIERADATARAKRRQTHNPCSLVSSEKCHVIFGCGGGWGGANHSQFNLQFSGT